MNRLASLILMLAMTGTFASEPASRTGNSELIQTFVAAYNSRDLDQMLALVAPAVRWYSVDGASVQTETDGIDALRTAMAADFSSGSTTQSALVATAEDGPMVTAIERAQWSVGGELRAQCSASVYRIEQGLIQEIWYFPAYACSADTSR